MVKWNANANEDPKKFRNSHTPIITHAVTEVTNKFNNVNMQREDTQIIWPISNITRKTFYNENKDLRNYFSIPQVFKSLSEQGSIN